MLQASFMPSAMNHTDGRRILANSIRGIIYIARMDKFVKKGDRYDPNKGDALENFLTNTIQIIQKNRIQICSFYDPGSSVYVSRCLASDYKEDTNMLVHMIDG
jgi:hypothetical protein